MKEKILIWMGYDVQRQRPKESQNPNCCKKNEMKTDIWIVGSLLYTKLFDSHTFIFVVGLCFHMNFWYLSWLPLSMRHTCHFGTTVSSESISIFFFFFFVILIHLVFNYGGKEKGSKFSYSFNMNTQSFLDE